MAEKWEQLRLTLADVDMIRMHLEVRGEGVVTAADIVAPPEVKIINPDLYLFTVDDNKVNLEIGFTVEAGHAILPPMTAPVTCQSASGAGGCGLQPGT